MKPGASGPGAESELLEATATKGRPSSGQAAALQGHSIASDAPPRPPPNPRLPLAVMGLPVSAGRGLVRHAQNRPQVLEFRGFSPALLLFRPPSHPSPRALTIRCTDRP
ncbi:uncharacterized protein VTP21DRAFT_9423 [Calcarisporiella thermophila]|uniref:uncharacterized protein n=1 Tax=Calcarisporiella thermophila TaxID=911321 RepID=UPI0037442251